MNYLQAIYDSIIYRDLIARFGIRNIKAFKGLAHYLFTNFTSEVSYNSLNKWLSLSNVNTVKDYVDYLQRAYLGFECYKFDFSLKNQIIYHKKFYVIDNGLRNGIAFYQSENRGKYLENLVFLHLKQRYGEVWFIKTPENYEVDFVVLHDGQYTLFQVCHDMSAPQTLERELRSLKAASLLFKNPRLIVLTYNLTNRFEDDYQKIEVIPVWRFLLEGIE